MSPSRSFNPRPTAAVDTGADSAHEAGCPPASHPAACCCSISPPTPMPSQVQPQPLEQPRVVYVRRNLTVAELILLFALSIGVVSGIQMLWSGVSGMLPRIEIKYDK